MITVRMSEECVEQLDGLVASGAYATRAGVVRAAVDRLLRALESEAIDKAIVEGYTRIPQTEDEIRWARRAAIESIREEPW